MNMVDNIVKYHKYTGSFKKRHVSSQNNISSFYCLQPNYINSETKHIINTNFINCKDVDILIKCAEYKIKITANIYWMSFEDLQKLISFLIKINDFSVIKKINYISIDKVYFQLENKYPHILACKNGHINIVKYLHKQIKLTNSDFQLEHNKACYKACKNGHLNIVKYLHKQIKLTNIDFQSHYYGYACHNFQRKL